MNEFQPSPRPMDTRESEMRAKLQAKLEGVADPKIDLHQDFNRTDVEPSSTKPIEGLAPNIPNFEISQEESEAINKEIILPVVKRALNHVNKRADNDNLTDAQKATNDKYLRLIANAIRNNPGFEDQLDISDKTKEAINEYNTKTGDIAAETKEVAMVEAENVVANAMDILSKVGTNNIDKSTLVRTKIELIEIADRINSFWLFVAKSAGASSDLITLLQETSTD